LPTLQSRVCGARSARGKWTECIAATTIRVPIPFCFPSLCGHYRLVTTPVAINQAHRIKWEDVMQDHVYKVIDLVGSSEKSIEDAINNAVSRASETLRNLRWFEVAQVRGQIENGKVHYYQAVLRVGFTMEDARD
jgi:dodecin